MKKMSKTFINNAITYALVIVAFIVMTILQNAGVLTRSMKGQLIPICVYIVMAVSLNLVVGISGELCLGHAGFMSVGAFTGVVAAACLEGGVPSPTLRLILAMIVGGLLAAVAGVIIGVPVLRLRGDYLAIVTLACGEIIKNVITNLNFTGGALGLNTTAIYAGAKELLPYGAVLVLLTVAVMLNLKRSKYGRAIMAIRDNRIAAESVGVNVTTHKMTAFVISAAMAGAAGPLFAMNYSTIVANKFDFNTSILILVFVVLGGQGNMLGSIIAAAVLTILPEALREYSDYRMLVYAILLIVMMLATNNPTIKGFLENVKNKITHKDTKEKEGV